MVKLAIGLMFLSMIPGFVCLAGYGGRANRLAGAGFWIFFIAGLVVLFLPVPSH